MKRVHKIAGMPRFGLLPVYVTERFAPARRHDFLCLTPQTGLLNPPRPGKPRLNIPLRSARPASQICTAPAPRAMTRADLPAYAQLFCRVFRKGDMRHAGAIETYMRACLFEAPGYDPAVGPMVQEDGNGEIAAIIGFIPLPMLGCGREMTARLGTAFLSNPDAAPGAAGRITTLLRARRQDFIFSNTGADMPARAVVAGGGQTLPLQGLDFHRIFRPLAMACKGRLSGLLHPLINSLDNLARRLKPGLVAQAEPMLRVAPLARAELLEAAPAMVERFAVRPRWHADDLNWQLDMAGANTAHGPFQQLGLRDANGCLVGIALCYAKPGGAVVLLNLMTLAGFESAVMRALFAHVDAQGHTTLRGEAQPWLMGALAAEAALFYRFRGHFMVLTRHDDVAEAVRRGDFYAGGLVGEIWCRLVADFQ